MGIKNYFLGVAGTVVCCVIAYFFIEQYQSPVYEPTNYSGLMNATGRADYAAQYYNMLRGDENGVINFKDVLKARNQVRNFIPSKDAAKDIDWRYLGPDFVGGRTRGLWRDNTTENSSVIYAGSVSGGIFISYSAGENWYGYNSDITSLCISSISQTANGELFVATGSDHEGLQASGTNVESGHPGDGLFRRKINASGPHTFTRVVGPATQNSAVTNEWRTINKILGHPTEDNKLYVGMNKGLRVTTNAGDEEVTFFNPVELAPGNPFMNTIDDISMNASGSRVYITAGSVVIVLQDNGGTNITKIHNESFAGASRMTVAASPDNDSIVYLCATGAGSCLYGIYQSRDGGLTWKQIGNKSPSFDPFENPGVNCQGGYDQCIGVFPGDPGKVLVGGVHLWKWQEAKNNPGFGTWSKIAVTQGGGLVDTNYVHADKHRFLFTDQNTAFIATDGGIHKSIDGGRTWGTVNNGFNVTQFYTMDAALGYTEFNGQPVSFEQVMGGTQDNGTILVGIDPFRPKIGVEILGGDGFDCAFSSLGNLAFATIYNGSLSRVSVGGGVQSFYDQELSEKCPECGPFYTRMAYWETANAEKTYDSLKLFINDTIKSGDTIVYSSATSDFIEQYWLSSKDLNEGDSIMVPDFVQSKLVFHTGGSELYMTADAPKVNQIGTDWSMITNGTDEYPDAMSGGIFSFTFTEDGNHLFVGTTGGNIFRISNLNEAYNDATMDVRNNSCVLTCTQIRDSGGGFISDLDVDPNNPEILVASVGRFNNDPHVLVCSTAVSATGSVFFKSIQGDLPYMPVYSAVVAEHNGNTVMVGTEFGVWATDDAGSSNPTWVQSQGMPRTPVYRLKQQTVQYIAGPEFPEFVNAHYRKVYAGTHGRGFWVTDNLVGIDDHSDKIAAAQKGTIQLKIYPNPLRDVGKLKVKTSDGGNASIEIFDLSGRNVSTVYNGNLKSGEQTIDFNISGLRNGTYIARLRTDEGSQIAKFVVLK